MHDLVELFFLTNRCIELGNHFWYSLEFYELILLLEYIKNLILIHIFILVKTNATESSML